MAGSQIQDYAFNTQGWAIRIPDGINDDPTVLTALKPSSAAWQKVADLLEAKGEQPWRPSLSLTPEEHEDLTNEDDTKARYLLVGFTLRNLKPEHFKKHPSQKKQRPVGIQLHPDSVIDTTTHLPIMVVAQIQETEPATLPLYALLKPKNGLCRPYHIAKDACFYLPRFRDETTILRNRQLVWNMLVKRECIRPRAPAGTASVSSQAPAGFPRTQDALCNFVDNGVTDWGPEDSAKVIQQFYETWPEARDMIRLKIDDIGIVKGQMLRDDLFVEDRLLHPFVLACKAMIMREELRTEGVLLEPDWSDIAGASLFLVREILG